MRSKVFVVFFLISQVSGFSFLEYFYPKKYAPFSGSYLNAAIQITAHALHQLSYIQNATPNKTDIFQNVFIETDKDVIILNFTDQVNVTRHSNDTGSTKVLKTLLVKLTKEAERLAMEAYEGFNDDLLAFLSETSPMTATSQLMYVLRNIEQNLIREPTKESIQVVLRELETKNSALVKQLDKLSPLVYLPLNKSLNHN